MYFDEINYNNTLKAIGYLEKKYQPASSKADSEVTKEQATKENVNQNKIPGVMFKSLSLIKFRRIAIMVLFVMKLRRARKPSSSSHLVSPGPDFALIDMLNRGLQNLKQEINR